MLDKLTLRKSVEIAIAAEQLGAERYDQLTAKFTQTPEVAGIFKQLASDERDHEAQFKALLKTVPPDEAEDEIDDRYLFLRAAAGAAFLAGEKGALWKPDEIKTPADALTQSLAFEKESVLFYNAIEDIIGESPALKAIIAAEKNHVATLMRVMVSDAKFRGLGDNW